MSYDDREATIARLRDLNGVMERALANAARVAIEAADRETEAGERLHDLGERRLFEALVTQAAGELEDSGAFHGRWSLFAEDELALLAEATRPSGGWLAREIEVERAARPKAAV